VKTLSLLQRVKDDYDAGHDDPVVLRELSERLNNLVSQVMYVCFGEKVVGLRLTVRVRVCVCLCV